MRILSVTFLFAIASLSHAENHLDEQLITNEMPTLHTVDHPNTLVAMSDEELSETQGQALYSLNRQEQGGLSFYTLSMEATVDLNANIKKLQLGCGGDNGTDKCDLDISDLSFGCVTNSAGTCITLPKTDSRQPNGASQETTLGGVTQGGMKDFTLKNPFFQFAVKDADKASTREIMGIRIGSAQANGPLSFGNLLTFSGYLTGQANLDMQEMGKGRNPDAVAVTCGPDSPPCPGNLSGTGYNAYGYTGDRTLGLANDSACVLLVICEQFKNLTVSFNGAQRTGLPVVVNGNRVTQALVSNLELGSAVDGIVDSLTFVSNQGIIPAGLIQIIKPIIAGQVKSKIKNQLATGLGTSVTALDNNTYKLPFNLSNVHSIDVNSNSFGIALSKQAIQYPGYAVSVNKGWSMYLQDAFTLTISEPTTRLVGNIAKGSGADGNIALLSSPYRNCYGSLKFC